MSHQPAWLWGAPGTSAGSRPGGLRRSTELLCGEDRGLAFLWSHSDRLLKPGPSGRLLQTSVCGGTDPPSWSSSKARHFPHDSGLPSLLGH